MSNTKRYRTLDTSRARPVQAGVSAAEHAAVAAYCADHDCTISIVVREVIAACSALPSEPSEPTAKYLSARLDPEDIALLTGPAQAAGVEPTTWLRLAVLAYVGAGGGDALRRQLVAAATAGAKADE